MRGFAELRRGCYYARSRSCGCRHYGWTAVTGRSARGVTTLRNQRFCGTNSGVLFRGQKVRPAPCTISESTVRFWTVNCEIMTAIVQSEAGIFIGADSKTTVVGTASRSERQAYKISRAGRFVHALAGLAWSNKTGFDVHDLLWRRRLRPRISVHSLISISQGQSGDCRPRPNSCERQPSDTQAVDPTFAFGSLDKKSVHANEVSVR